MSARRVRRGRRRNPRRQHKPAAPRGPALPRFTWSLAVLAVTAGTLAATRTAQGRSIVVAVQRFLLFYSGVFALLALTAAVVIGLAGTDRIVMTPGSRVVAQVAHRVIALSALAALATHVVLEILAHRSAVADAVVPFVARGRTFYVGLGTLASDLIVLIVATSVVRGRFAANWPWAWRAVHATAYLTWSLSILHGLLAGRTAKPYVDWSYGACAAAVAVALAIRIVAAHRGRAHHRPLPVPGRPATPVHGGIVVGGRGGRGGTAVPGRQGPLAISGPDREHQR